MNALLADDEPAAVTCERPTGRSKIFLACDHASNRIPKSLGDLGVSSYERARHIGWDIGALGVARGLSMRLDATLVWQNYSRLVIDCNRPPHSPDSVIERSEATDIPGNHGLSEAARQLRMDALFRPYHETLRALLDARAAAQRETVFVAIHSFTPIYHGQSRPWDVGLLYADDARLAKAMIATVDPEHELKLGDNEPYRIDAKDHTIPEHPLKRKLPNVLLEIRQDLIADVETQNEWARRLSAWLLRATETLDGDSSPM